MRRIRLPVISEGCRIAICTTEFGAGLFLRDAWCLSERTFSDTALEYLRAAATGKEPRRVCKC